MSGDSATPAASGGRKGLIPALSMVAAAAVLLGLFSFLGTPVGHSYTFNMAWAVVFSDALVQGAFYPRHLPALWEGFGGLDFFFYGPLPFYVHAGPASWICQGCSLQVTFALAGGLIWVGSGLSFWLFAGRFFPRLPALVASAAYMVMPYHLIDWFTRQAVGEFAAYLFLPFAAHGLLVAMRDGRPSLTLPIGVAGLAFCHLPTFLLAAHVLGAIGIVWWLRAPRARLRPILWTIAMATAGVAIAAIYWLPAMALLGDVSPEALTSSDLVPSAWYLIGPGAQTLSSGYRLALLLCQVAAAVLAAAAILAARGRLRRDLVLWAGLPVVGVLFLNSAFSAPIWDHWVIGEVQFPFRLTVFSDMAGALSVGALMAMWQGGTFRPRGLRPPQVCAVVGAGVLVMAMAASMALSARAVGIGFNYKGNEVKLVGPGEYLPPLVFAPIREVLDANDEPIWNFPVPMLDFVRSITGPGAEEVQPDMVAPRTWRIPPGTTPEQAVALPYWIHLRAETASGTPVDLSPDPRNGLLRLGPSGGEAITVSLPPHWSERIGLALSAAGLIGALALGLLFGRLRRTGDATADV